MFKEKYLETVSKDSTAKSNTLINRYFIKSFDARVETYLRKRYFTVVRIIFFSFLRGDFS